MRTIYTTRKVDIPEGGKKTALNKGPVEVEIEGKTMYGDATIR
jgi:hypothetical protein